MDNFLNKYKTFGYDWEFTHNKYIDVDKVTPCEEIEIYSTYIMPNCYERIKIIIEKKNDNTYIAWTDSLADAMFELLGSDNFINNKYLIRLKQELSNLKIYNNLKEHFNSIMYEFTIDNFDFYNLNNMCIYCITVITMIMNYKNKLKDE